MNYYEEKKKKKLAFQTASEVDREWDDYVTDRKQGTLNKPQVDSKRLEIGTVKAPAKPAPTKPINTQPADKPIKDQPKKAASKESGGMDSTDMAIYMMAQQFAMNSRQDNSLKNKGWLQRKRELDDA